MLLRAGEVVAGLDVARSRRPGATDRDLCRGPARLTKALGIDGALTGTDLLDPGAPVRLVLPSSAAGPVERGPRVGVSGEGGVRPWRFWLAGDRTVSVYRPGVQRRRAGSA